MTLKGIAALSKPMLSLLLELFSRMISNLRAASEQLGAMMRKSRSTTEDVKKMRKRQKEISLENDARAAARTFPMVHIVPERESNNVAKIISGGPQNAVPWIKKAPPRGRKTRMLQDLAHRKTRSLEIWNNGPSAGRG